MTKKYILFDMDGVLLEPNGYHKSLQKCVNLFGNALGVPNTNLEPDHIAEFEALGITNEWDSLAICTATILIHAWKYDSSIRFKGIQPILPVTEISPDIGIFLKDFPVESELPGLSALDFLEKVHKHLNRTQSNHLYTILANCRDIYQSQTQPFYQETVLGSELFQKTYGLKPELHIESYLEKYDRSILNDEEIRKLQNWIKQPDHHAGIMTNRPSQTPGGQPSPPEAEIGAKSVHLDHVPLVGSGYLGWYAEKHCNLPAHTLLKPNPVHTLALLQICNGKLIDEALSQAYALWKHQKDKSSWQFLDKAIIYIFEDAVKGLQSGIKAVDLLKSLGLPINIHLIGVANEVSKITALKQITPKVISSISKFNWNKI
jgi:hypothetical protein